MTIFEKFQGFLGEKEQGKSSEEQGVDALRGRIKDLERERERLIDAGKTAPEGYEIKAQIERINQEIENIERELRGEPPLIFHNSVR